MRHSKTLSASLLAAIAVCLVVAITSTAMADSGPYATVYNSKSEVVGKWGSFYGAQPGGQIQMAENFAECGNTESCSSFPEKPLYPKVVLEPGTFEILKAYGAIIVFTPTARASSPIRESYCKGPLRMRA